MNRITESTVEEATLSWFESLGYTVLHGPDIAPDEPRAERQTYNNVVLAGRLREAIGRLNADIPSEACDEALRKLTRPESASLVVNNRTLKATNKQ